MKKVNLNYRKSVSALLATVAVCAVLWIFVAPVQEYQSELVPVKDAGTGKWGYADTTGKVVIAFQYDAAEAFHEGLAKVYLNRKYGFIDRTGNESVPLKYDMVDNFSEKLAAVKLEEKYGFIDKTGKVVIAFRYDTAEAFHKGLAKVHLNRKYGFIDTTGTEVILPKYDSVGSFSKTVVKVKLADKYGYVDLSGQEIIPVIYDEIGSFSNIPLPPMIYRIARVKSDGKYGYVDQSGKEMIPCKYREIGPFSDGIAKANLNGKWIYLSPTGQAVSIKTLFKANTSEMNYAENVTVSFALSEDGRTISDLSVQIKNLKYSHVEVKGHTSHTHNLSMISATVNFQGEGRINSNSRYINTILFGKNSITDLNFQDDLTSARGTFTCVYEYSSGNSNFDIPLGSVTLYFHNVGVKR